MNANEVESSSSYDSSPAVSQTEEKVRGGEQERETERDGE